MTPRLLAFSGLGCAIVTFAAAGWVAVHIYPRAVDASERGKRARSALAGLEAELRSLPSALSAEGEAARAFAAAAFEHAAALSELLESREAVPSQTGDSARDAFISDLAARTGAPATSLRALLPAGDVHEAEGIFQFVTTRDLALAAAASGIREFIYIVYPQVELRDTLPRFGPFLKTREVKMEYVSTYEAHRALVLELVRRRDRGPFYSFIKIDVRANPDSVPGVNASAAISSSTNNSPRIRATLDLARVLPGGRQPWVK